VKKKRSGTQPRGRGTPIEVRLQSSDLKALDFWIRQQGTNLTRSDAIRSLIGILFRIMKVDRAFGKSPTAVQLSALRIHHILQPDEFPEMKVERLTKAELT